MTPSILIPYPGTTPATNALVHILFATTAVTGSGSSFPDPGWGKGALPAFGYKRLLLDLKHDQAGTLNWYKSDNGSTWHQVDTEAIAAPAGTDSTVRDFLIEEYPYFYLAWVQGATPQTVWAPNVSLSPERAT